MTHYMIGDFEIRNDVEVRFSTYTLADAGKVLTSFLLKMNSERDMETLKWMILNIAQKNRGCRIPLRPDKKYTLIMEPSVQEECA